MTEPYPHLHYPFTLPDTIVDDRVVARSRHEAPSTLSDLQLAILQHDPSTGDDNHGNAMDFHAFENVEVARVMMSVLQGKEEREQSKSYEIGDLGRKMEDDMEVGTFGLLKGSYWT